LLSDTKHHSTGRKTEIKTKVHRQIPIFRPNNMVFYNPAMVLLSLLPVVGISWVALKLESLSKKTLVILLIASLISITRFRKKSG